MRHFINIVESSGKMEPTGEYTKLILETLQAHNIEAEVFRDMVLMNRTSAMHAFGDVGDESDAYEMALLFVKEAVGKVNPQAMVSFGARSDEILGIEVWVPTTKE